MNSPRGCRRPRKRRSIFRRKPPSRSAAYGLEDEATREFGTRCLIATTFGGTRSAIRTNLYLHATMGSSWRHRQGLAQGLSQSRSARGRLGRRSEGPRHCWTRRSCIGAAKWADCPSFRTRRTSDVTTIPMASACGWPEAAIKSGYVHGATDDFGHQAVDGRGQPLRLSRDSAAPVRHRCPTTDLPTPRWQRLAAGRPTRTSRAVAARLSM